MMKPQRSITSARLKSAAGFSMVEMLITTAIMTLVVGGAMTVLMDSVRANQRATMVTSMNANLRTGMDLIVRDLLQTGQDLPVGRVVSIAHGNASAIRLPGPPGTDYKTDGATIQLSAVIPGPGLGPTVNGVATDTITILAADSSFSNVDLTNVTDTSMTVALPAPPSCDPRVTTCVKGQDISNGGSDDVLPGQLIMLTKGSVSTLVQVTTVDGVQTANFASGDSLRLNQTGADAGTLPALNGTTPSLIVAAEKAQAIADTQATRIRMISYYIDATTTPSRPRLVRRMNNGDPTKFDNILGNVVAFDVENLQLTYDLADGVTNPSNVRMDATDLSTAGKCAPSACSPNQIRKVNVMLFGRSNTQFEPTKQFFRNTLQSQVSLRSLAFVDNYGTNVVP